MITPDLVDLLSYFSIPSYNVTSVRTGMSPGINKESLAADV